MASARIAWDKAKATVRPNVFACKGSGVRVSSSPPIGKRDSVGLLPSLAACVNAERPSYSAINGVS